MNEPGESHGTNPTKRIRALAFAGGGFDTAMQLGVAHALLVSQSLPPDHVVGLSAGAINAAALAEILKAGQALPANARLGVQIETFRRFLAAYQEVPGQLLQAVFPDTFEIAAKDPLKPLELPIHFEKERRARDAANLGRAGLVRLLNDLLAVRVSVGTITKIIRRILAITAAADDPSFPRRLWTGLKNAAGVWLLCLVHIFQLAPTVGTLIWAIMLGEKRPRHRTAGQTAGGIILRGRLFRRLWRLLKLTLQVLLLFLLLGVTLFLTLLLFVFRKWAAAGAGFCGDRILGYFDLADGLANTDVLRQQLVKHFDKTYYGRVDITDVLARALARSSEPARSASGTEKLLASYVADPPRIHVAPVAAAVESGSLEVIPLDVPVVDALLAATAIVPFFPAVPLRSRAFARTKGSPDPDLDAAGAGAARTASRTFIDGLNVANEAVAPLIDYLRKHIGGHDAAGVDIYPVSDLPITAGDLPGERPRYYEMLQVVSRALQLKRFRDATIEQRLTALYSRTLAPGRARVAIKSRVFINASIYPLEPQRPVRVNAKVIMGEANQELQNTILETVADGCRVSLEGIIPDSVRTAAQNRPSVPCRSAIAHRLQTAWALPGSLSGGGPGLPEICGNCALSRDPGRPTDPATRQRLAVRPNREQWPEWPLTSMPAAHPAPGGLPSPAGPQPPSVTPPSEDVVGPAPLLPARTDVEHGPDSPPAFAPGWPRDFPPSDSKPGLQGKNRPVITILFGGGVFRGVYHLGVLNALHEIGLAPDLVAGSSVGSLIAAMIAEVFVEPDIPARRRQILNLTATFLTMDRLILTDRLVDFIRLFTLHAASTRLSLRDVDLAFRRFDYFRTLAFTDRLRRIAAGFERLFHFDSFTLMESSRAARQGDYRKLTKLLGAAVQVFLDRSGVGSEILGTEPLELLIRSHVLERLATLAPASSADLFIAFNDHSVYFLATATNLTQGRLEILGSPYGPRDVALLDGLLASSAFPGLFRPREAWEIFRTAGHADQYIDGGTMDNLPLDAVARFLDGAATRGVITRRPVVARQHVPHLLFTASLDVARRPAPPGNRLADKNCLVISRAAKTFSYNRKIDSYAKAQADLRFIFENSASPPPWTPLDLEVVAVKPEWLCNTFGFHPMLGFRRKKQTESIAHGCASTFATLHRLGTRGATETAWLKAWGVRDAVRTIEPSTVEGAYLAPRKHNKAPGECWFRTSVMCPYSPGELRALKLPPIGISELSAVYDACGRETTHRPAR